MSRYKLVKWGKADVFSPYYLPSGSPPVLFVPAFCSLCFPGDLNLQLGPHYDNS